MTIRRRKPKKPRAELLSNSNNTAIVMTTQGWKYPGIAKVIPFGHAKYVKKTQENTYVYETANI